MNTNLIINTGGTFNKVYNQLNGELEILTDNSNITEILTTCYRGNYNGEIVSPMYIDSLDMTKSDRIKIKEAIETSPICIDIVIIHGTDTMDKTAKYLNKHLSEDILKNCKIVLTGAMIPYSIDKQEATSNFISAMTFAEYSTDNGIFIAMHGMVEPHKDMVKDRHVGIFKVKD